MMKGSIGRKLVFTYLLLILISLTVSGAMFRALIQQYMVAEAKQTLYTEAQKLIRFTGDIGDPNLPLSRKVITQMIDTDFFVVNQQDLRVVQSNRKMAIGSTFPIPLPNVFAGQEQEGVSTYKDHHIVYVALPIVSIDTGQVTQALVLLTDLQQINSATSNIVYVLLKGFAITLPILLLLAYMMMRSVTRPLHALRQAVDRMAHRDFTPPEIVESGDELEEFSREFRRMALALQQYDEGQRRFLQNASHELKTPLMAIQGYAEGIHDGMFQGEEAKRGLEVISKESKRLKKIVDELIYLSKLETLNDIYDWKPHDVPGLIRECVENVTSIARKKGIEIHWESEEVSPQVLDRDKMAQALMNLLGNGIRHAHQHVWVRLHKAGSGFRLTVEDDGDGIKEAELPRIFERFFHGDKGETGLGLAITRAIVEKNGGTIRAENRPEGGAKFILDFAEGSAKDNGKKSPI